MQAWKIRTIGVLLAASLAGCDSLPINMSNLGIGKSSVKASPAQLAKYEGLSALEVVETLEKSLNSAKADNMPFLAPRHFRDASQTLSKCQSSLGNKNREELVNCAAEGDATLEKGRAIMDIVNYRFSQELALKARLDANNTEKLLPREYAKVIGDLSGLIDIVERERPDNIDKEKDAVLKALQDLEVQSIQEGALHESADINADSKKKNADKQAPLTFAQAQKTYQEAKDKIAAAPHDQALVERLGAEALFAARHAQQVNERVALLESQLHLPANSGISLSGAVGGLSGAQLSAQSSGKAGTAKSMTPEQIVLQEENRLLNIATAMGLKDMRDQPLEKQLEAMKRAAGELASQSGAAMHDLEERLKAANEATRQALSLSAEKDRQLADKDAQISDLTEQLNQLGKAAKPAAKAKKQ